MGEINYKITVEFLDGDIFRFNCNSEDPEVIMKECIEFLESQKIISNTKKTLFGSALQGTFKFENPNDKLSVSIGIKKGLTISNKISLCLRKAFVNKLNKAIITVEDSTIYGFMKYD